MAGALRLPSLRFLIVLIAFLTTIHYFLSYTSPTYVEKTNFPGSLPDISGRKFLGKYAYREDGNENLELPKGWLRGQKYETDVVKVVEHKVEPVKARRARAAFVVLVRNQEVHDIVGSIREMEGALSSFFILHYFLFFCFSSLRCTMFVAEMAVYLILGI